MSIIGWSGRGLGQPATVQELDCLVQTYRPFLVFICETRQSEERVKNLRFRIGMKNCFQVKGEGSGGGLALYYQDDITVELLSFSIRHIDVHISGGPFGLKWRGTFVYGEPRACDRHRMWTTLWQLKPRSSEPWLMMGDFNEAMWQEEHLSRTKRSERLMMDFREVLSHCDLHDIGFAGTPWTYDNKKKGDRNVKVRLDRAFATPSWSACFHLMRLRHLTSSRSDHYPLLLAADVADGSRPLRPIRRYEIMWEREPSLPAAVEEAWSRRVPVGDLGHVAMSMQTIMASPYSWKSKHFKSIPREMEEKSKELEALSLLSDDESVIKKEELAREMDELLYIEEIMWLQRSRVAWLREGDRNTKYFHRRETWRRKKNRVCKLKRPDGSWTMEAREMEELTLDYFKKLYTSEDDIDPRIITDLMQPCVDADANERL
ncbi:uncharacterized protein [Lolium perenne]|uniref:uncharacterized protein n=1 Tax=Lolium perenne TaxID=4522 RepID=UPI003A9A6251